MVLSEFTSEHLKQFKKNKYNLSNDSELVKLIRTERDRVKHFIINNPNLKIKMDKIDDNYNQLNEKINEYSKVSWVDTKSVISELNRLNNYTSH
jgi:predicted nuclease with TOPRIM domain